MLILTNLETYKGLSIQTLKVLFASVYQCAFQNPNRGSTKSFLCHIDLSVFSGKCFSMICCWNKMFDWESEIYQNEDCISDQCFSLNQFSCSWFVSWVDSGCLKSDLFSHIFHNKSVQKFKASSRLFSTNWYKHWSRALKNIGVRSVWSEHSE